MKDINLIPKHYINSKKRRSKKAVGLFFALILVVIITAAIGYPLWMKHDLMEQNEDILEQVKESSSYIEVEKQFNLVKGLYNQRIDLGSKLRIYGTSLTGILDKLESEAPVGLFIVTLNTSGSESSANEISVSISGIARSQADVATYISNLRRNGYFSNIFLSSININSSQSSQDSSSADNTEKECTFNITLFLDNSN